MVCSDLLSVYILSEDRGPLSLTYSRIFTQKNGFQTPILVKFRKSSPSPHPCLTSDQAIHLSHQLKIWKRCVQENKPIVICNNATDPTLCYDDVAKLIKSTQRMDQCDIVYYGKYLDQCHRYVHSKDISVSKKKYSLYQTFSPYGMFAYMIFPSGARKLIQESKSWPAPVEVLANRLTERCELKAYTFHPSLIKVRNIDEAFQYECREPEMCEGGLTWGQVLWYLILLIIIFALIGILLYFFSINISYNPDQEIHSGFQKLSSGY